MSFSNSVKTEILDGKPLRSRHKDAFAHGLFRFGKGFPREALGTATENLAVAQLYASLLEQYLGLTATVAIRQSVKSGKTLHTVWLPEEEDRLGLLEKFPAEWNPEDELPAFLAGAFLSCGNVTDPEKAYHLELLTREKQTTEHLRKLLDGALPGARVTTRRGSFMFYYKDCSQIEDFLTLIGAPKACLHMIDVEMIKTVRNVANRVTNCETANIDKTVNASAHQVADIRFLLGEIGAAALPENLLEVAMLRLNEPDFSLREISAQLGISRSGAHHRLDKLARMAAEIRRERGEDADA